MIGAHPAFLNYCRGDNAPFFYLALDGMAKAMPYHNPYSQPYPQRLTRPVRGPGPGLFAASGTFVTPPAILPELCYRYPPQRLLLGFFR